MLACKNYRIRVYHFGTQTDDRIISARMHTEAIRHVVGEIDPSIAQITVKPERCTVSYGGEICIISDYLGPSTAAAPVSLTVSSWLRSAWMLCRSRYR